MFRRNRTRFPDGCDVVAIAKRGAPDLDYQTVLSEVVSAQGALETAARKARLRLEGVAERAGGPEGRGH